MDSDATHHFTPNCNIMNFVTPYYEHKQVLVGDGKSYPIFHVGHAMLPTSPTLLHLTNILHSLSLAHNLISVTKLCIDNRGFVEFHPNFSLVKDQVMKKTLL